MVQRPIGNKDQTVYPGDMSVGEILRRTRMHYGQSPLDIERALRIKATQVEAIENSDFEKLPGRVYAIGFVRSYSEYLGLDSDHMVSLFKSQSGVRTVKPELHFPVPASESKLPQTWLVAAGVVMAFGLLGLWWDFSSTDRSLVNDVPPIPDTIKAEGSDVAQGAPAVAGPPVPQTLGKAAVVATAPAAQTVAAAVPAAGAVETPIPTVSAADASKGIILKIIQNSWVEIKDRDGKEVVSRVLKAGDKYFVPARPDLFMSLGNSGGVKIEIDGKELPDLGPRGEVLRNVPLDVDFLKRRYSAGHAIDPVN